MGQANPPARVALIVEDDAYQRELAAALLEETDLRVVEAATAEEALRYLKSNAHEVAFLFADVRLPRILDGIDLAQLVALSWPWISIMITSGAAGDRLDDLPRKAAFMPKPWRALDVLMAAERAAGAGR